MPTNEPEYLALLAWRAAEAASNASAAGTPTEPVNLYPYSGLQHIGFFILFLFPSLALVVVCLRIYSRSTTKQFGWDDGLIVVAMAVSIAETGASYIGMRTSYIGVHIFDIPPEADLTLGMRWNYTLQLLYNPILAIVKTSVLMFMLRLGGTKQAFRWAIYSLNAFNICLAFGIFFACMFQCTPIPYFWDKTIPGGSCVNMGAFYVSTAALTILTDILVLALPFWIFLGLKMPAKVKVALLFVFLLGTVVTVFSVLRLSWIVETSFYPMTGDFTYDIRFTYSAVETNLAIMTASAPALRPLFLKWFPRLFSSLGYGSGQRYGGTGPNKYGGNGTNSKYGNGTGARHGSALRSGHQQLSSTPGSGTGNGAYALRDLWRSDGRSHSPTASEEEIMASNGAGIVRTTEVQIAYGDKTPVDARSRTDEEIGQTKFGYSTNSTGSL